MGGTAEAAQETVLIIACGALAREILALKRANRLDHVALQCLPAELHNRPERIAGAVRDAIFRARPRFERISVAYGECGTGGALDRVLEEEKIERLEGPQCYAFFSELDNFNAAAGGDIDAFYLTDFLARHFDRLVYGALGLDRHPELRDQYFRHYSRLVYLAQSEDRDLLVKAREAARRLRLKFEMRRTGYGELQKFVAAL
ncbi:MAG: DUF1638 domain-containing protein [Alphaproteobacteria bacterium]|nr:DUF1638 domain-containing protein [Alphaproteobacteria bacterium]